VSINTTEIVKVSINSVFHGVINMTEFAIESINTTEIFMVSINMTVCHGTDTYDSVFHGIDK
jgi:hypothetical protein